MILKRTRSISPWAGCVAGLVTTLSLALPPAAQAAFLDPTFGDNGKQLVDIGGTIQVRGEAQSVAVQSDDKSVVAGMGRGVFAVDGTLYDALNGGASPVMALDEAKNLPGAHNWQNAALAYAATKRFVKEPRAIAAAIASFPGLAHRMEAVGTIGRVRFVNDSKATNADAAARALAVYPDIFWIAGGKPKEGGIESLSPFFSRIRRAYLIGEAAPAFARTLDGKAPYVMAGTLERAVELAAADAAASSAPSPVVLLSPACASYDQFKDFEQRGNAFAALVARLPQTVEAAS